VRSAIPHPRIMGVIKECGGKMWMGERKDISFVHRTFSLLIHHQVNGTEPVKTSLSHFAITMKLGHHKGFKS
jgi:hypothetical protein